jgi:large exoprotein involved in heme utilization and adhesion
MILIAIVNRQGDGGAVTITTQGIIGLEATPTNTDRSNITASSERGVQGVVSLEPSETDLAQGLVQFPAVLTDVSNQIDQTCTEIRNVGEDGARNEFLVSGRGGLPPSLPWELQHLWLKPRDGRSPLRGRSS